jgi:hypothetical protein
MLVPMKRKKPITLAEHLASIASKGGTARMEQLTPEQRRNLASSGGLVGSKARADALSLAKRRAIAKKAAEARWGKKPPAPAQ